MGKTLNRNVALCVWVVGATMACPCAHAQRFAAPADYRTSGDPTFVAVGDLNHDGNLDLIAGLGDSIAISVLLGNGDGSFQPHQDYQGVSETFSIALGDFNRDGALDVVTANENGSTVSVFLGNGDGTLKSHVDYPTGGLCPHSVAISDFNSDGILDLVAANLCSSTVGVLLGNGDGTFRFATTYAVGATAPFVAVGDFNHDGTIDIVTPANFDNAVSLLLGNGDGTFSPYVEFPVGLVPLAVVVDDFNLDGNLDVAVANSDDNTVGILLGNGDGTFRHHVAYAAGPSPRAVIARDFNGDRIPDLALPIPGAGDLGHSVSVLMGNGDGTFRPPQYYETGIEPFSVATGDFNRDGAADLACPVFRDSAVAVLLNRGGTFLQTSSSQNPSRLGQAVTFTTTVMASLSNAGTPTGRVTFKDGVTTLGSVEVVAGQASFTTSVLKVGPHTIRARYSGDGIFNRHRADAISQEVLP